MASIIDAYIDLQLAHVTQTNVATGSTGAQTVTFTITADEGYKFDVDNGAYILFDYRNASGRSTSNKVTVTDSKTITYKIPTTVWAYSSSDYQIHISGTALVEDKVTPTVPTVVNNIANCTITYTDDGLDGWLFTAKCADGYIFDGGTVKVTYRDTTGGGVTKALTVNSDSAYIDVADDFNLNYDFTFEGATKKQTTPTVTVYNKIENTSYTAQYNESSGTLTVNVQASDSDGIFVVKPTITYTDSLGNIVTDDMVLDLTTEGAASAVIDDIDITGTVTLNGVCGRYVTVKTNLTNVTIKDAKAYYSADDVTTITINAADNTKLQAAQCYIYYTPTGGALVTKYFNISDGTTGTLTIVTPTSGTEINIVASASADVSYLDNYGTINAYICSNDNIKSFAAKRFYTDTTSTTAKDIDLGNYVHSVQRYYFDIATSAQDTIRCGNVNTGVVCRAPETDCIQVDFGTVTVPLTNNNVVDYNNTEIRLFVPCVGFIDIDSNYINTPLHLYLVCNIITGTTTYFVESDSITIATGSATPYTNMVFMLSNSNNNVIGNSIQSNDTVGLQAYITVVTHTSTNSAYNSTQRAVTLSDCNGYCRFSDIVLTGIQCTESEQTELLQLLQSGIIL